MLKLDNGRLARLVRSTRCIFKWLQTLEKINANSSRQHSIDTWDWYCNILRVCRGVQYLELGYSATEDLDTLLQLINPAEPASSTFPRLHSNQSARHLVFGPNHQLRRRGVYIDWPAACEVLGRSGTRRYGFDESSTLSPQLPLEMRTLDIWAGHSRISKTLPLSLESLPSWRILGSTAQSRQTDPIFQSSSPSPIHP